MAFDAEGFRNAAKGKFTDAEIEDVIARETVSKPTAVSPSNSITTTEIAPAEVAPAGRQTPLQRMETFNQKVAEEYPATSYLPYLGSAAVGAATVPLIYGTYKAGKAIYNSLSDKMAGGQPPSGGQPSSGSPMQKIDPDLTVSQKPTGTPEPTFDWRSYSPTQTTGEPTLNMQTLAPEQAANSPIEQLKARLTAAPTIAPEAPVPPFVALEDLPNPPISPVTPKVELAPVDVVKPTGETPGIAALKQALNPEEKIAIEKLTGTTSAVPLEGANAPVIPTEEQKATAEKVAKEKLTWPGLAEEKGPMRWMANTIGTVKDVKGSQAAFEIAKDKLEKLGVDLSPTDIKTGKKVGGGLIPEGHAVLNDFYKTYTGEDLPKGGKILTEQKMKLFDAVKTHLEEAHANGNLKTLGKGAMAAAAVLGISSAVQAAMNGDTSKLKELGFDLGISAIPVLGTAAAALTGTTLSPATLRSDAFAEVLNRPEVRQTLKTLQQTLPPADYNKARDKYLEKVSTFPQYATGRFTKPNILGAAPVNRNTLLPVAPPR
tara:strand:- start:51 stop:1682 length:1632 start_codon:yes stop_codon:yes gene_type:complete